MIPAIITGTTFLIIKSGRRTPIDAIPTPDFAVPYAAPKPVQVSTPWEFGKHTGEDDSGCTAHCTLLLENLEGKLQKREHRQDKDQMVLTCLWFKEQGLLTDLSHSMEARFVLCKQQFRCPLPVEIRIGFTSQLSSARLNHDSTMAKSKNHTVCVVSRG